MKKLGPALWFVTLGACSATSNTPADASPDAAPGDVTSVDVESELPIVGPWDVEVPDVILLDKPPRPPTMPVETPRCEPGVVAPCVCPDLREGLQACHDEGSWRACVCEPAPPPSAATGPRQLWPLSGTRVTSLRPTLRWVLPEGTTRARIELCDDRPCARGLLRVEVSGTTWRSATPLRPGVVFWRVSGLRADGSVAWTSATWEFLVGRRDRPTDNAYGGLKDFNGDGYDDVVAMVETPERSEFGSPVEELRVFSGGAEGISVTPTTIVRPLLPSAMRAAMGDLNGDGLADLVTFHWYWGINFSVRFGAREAMLSPATVIATPQGEMVELRTVHATAGDVTGDGFDDLLMLAAGPYVNVLRVYAGSAGGTFSSAPLRLELRLEQRATAGDKEDMAAITIAGDVDGDGYTDAVVTTLTKIFVVFGPVIDPSPRIQTLVYPHGGLYPMGGAAGADFNDDRRGDVAFGASLNLLYASAGRLAWVYERGALGSPLPSGSTGTVGDVDADGYADLSIIDTCIRSTPERRCHEIQMRLLRSGVDGLRSTSWWETPARMGMRHAIVGDVNGDGFDDLAYGDCSLNILRGSMTTPTADRTIALTGCDSLQEIR